MPETPLKTARKLARQSSKKSASAPRGSDAPVAHQEPSPVRQGGSQPVTWVYPYNFVGFADEVRRDQPPSWERFDGFSGRIECTLRNLTPLFIPDPEEIGQIADDPNREHKVAHFFNLEGKLAIPSTSLRGMIRSVAEAATNSCLSTFEVPTGEKQKRGRSLWRRDRGFMSPRDRYCRRVGKLLSDKDGWGFQELSYGTDAEGDEIRPKMPIYLAKGLKTTQNHPVHITDIACEKLHSHTWVVVGCTASDGASLLAECTPYVDVLAVDTFESRRITRHKVLVDAGAIGGTAGEQVWVKCPPDSQMESAPPVGAEIEQVVLVNTYRPQSGDTWSVGDCWRVRSLTYKHPDNGASRTCKVLSRNGLAGHVVPPPDFADRGGYTGNERFNNLRFHAVIGGDPGRTVDVSQLVGEFQWICEDRCTKSLRDTGPSLANRNSEIHHPFSGQLVTCQFTNNRGLPGNPVALGPVAMLLEYYDHHPAEFLPSSLRPCDDLDKLCPACRLFGTVNGKAPLAGRVSIGPAYSDLAHDQATSPVTLPILGEPKASYWPFYLKSADRANQDYNTSPAAACLRGRKFYWHQKSKLPQEYSFANQGSFNARKQPEGYPHTKLNMTAYLLSHLGSEFRFTVTFENLSEVELGLLLWTLKLEPGLAHKLGHGRPLGLGSVQIGIDELVLHDNTFEDLMAVSADGKSQVEGFIQKFTGDRDSFLALSYVADLYRMLAVRGPEHFGRTVTYQQHPGDKIDDLPKHLQDRKKNGPPLELPEYIVNGSPAELADARSD